MAGRPEAGWLSRQDVRHGTENWFVAVHGAWLVRGALRGGRAAGDAEGKEEAAAAPLGAAATELVHRLVAADAAVAEACVLGAGPTLVLQLVEAAKREGAWLRAARLLLAARLPGKSGVRPRAEQVQMLVAAQEVLEGKLDDSEAANWLELNSVLRELLRNGHTGEGRVVARLGVLQKRESVRGEGRAQTMEEMIKESLTAARAARYQMVAAWAIHGTGKPQDLLTLPSAEEDAEALRHAARAAELHKVRYCSALHGRALV